jgi:hypothetical protein
MISKENYFPIKHIGWGVNKREQFAAMAMQGLLANGNGPVEQWINDKGMVPLAMKAVECADALIEELNKKK